MGFFSDFFESLTPSSATSSELVKTKGKIGPLRFNLLDGLGTYQHIQLPERLDVEVVVDYEFAATDIVEMAQVSQAASDEVDRLRETLKPLMQKADRAIAACVRSGDGDTAERAIAAANRELSLLKPDAERNAKRAVIQAVKDMRDRQVDLVVNKLETAVDCTFRVIEIATSAKDVFTKPPGWNLVSPLITIVKATYSLVKTIKTECSDVWSVRDSVIEALESLEAARALHAKSWEEKSKTEVVQDLWNQVKEAVLDDIGDAEKVLKTYGAKTTGLDNKSKSVGGKLADLLELQSSLSEEGADELAGQVHELIGAITTMQEKFAFLLEEEKGYKKSLEAVTRDCSTAVVVAKRLQQAKDLLDPVGAAEAACGVLIQMGARIAKA